MSTSDGYFCRNTEQRSVGFRSKHSDLPNFFSRFRFFSNPIGNTHNLIPLFVYLLSRVSFYTGANKCWNILYYVYTMIENIFLWNVSYYHFCNNWLLKALMINIYTLLIMGNNKCNLFLWWSRFFIHYDHLCHGKI